MLTRDRENVIAENGDLQQELDMYKSVMVPGEHRPRTNITRLARAPFVNLTQSLNTGNISGPKGHVNGKVDDAVTRDMTLEEIL
jgi:hypothetical protein